MLKGLSICHLTSVHTRYDTRIFVKECASLANAGAKVSLIVADGRGEETLSEVSILDVGKPSGRLNRIFIVTKKIFKKAKLVDADIYHFHDPELIPIGLKLKKMGKCVIFDSHEDIPKQILGKHYLNNFAKKIISTPYAYYEAWACKKLDAIVTATPYIKDKFLRINSNSIDVNNYPRLDELSNNEITWENKDESVCYIGAITSIRGIREIVRSLSELSSNARLKLGGKFESSEFRKEVSLLEGWEKVDELGWLQRHEVKSCLEGSFAGLVLLHPTINYLDSLPVKMFEYMSVGIPVIASDFPLWKNIVEENECGVCVDPFDHRAIASAIDSFCMDKDKAKVLGENGRKAVTEKFNWGLEEKKLLNLYSILR